MPVGLAVCALFGFGAAGPLAVSADGAKFKYRYKVLAVRLGGVFKASYDSGLGRTFQGVERIRVRGVASGAMAKLETACAPGTCAFFDKGGLTLQNPPSKQVGITGMLETTRFNRSYKITGTETTETGDGVETVDCAETFEDVAGFVGLMRLEGSEIVAWWTLPALPFNCEPFGGHVSVDPFDRTSLESSDAQFTSRYSLREFRRRRVSLEVDIRHKWEPDSSSTASMRWQGIVELQRVGPR